MEEFCSDYYSRKPLLIPKCPGKFENLFGWKSFNRILNSSPIPHPTMIMALEGRQVIPTDANSIVERCREGASLIIEEVHKYDEVLGRFVAELAKEIGEPARVNIYFSQPMHRGYNRHYDTHDIFILQLAGYKGWQVFDATIEFPLFVQKSHATVPPAIPRLECTLEAGDVLYIPRGHWHEATAQVEPSLHLTLGIYARTGIDFMSWLTDELRDDVRWRKAFPLILSEDTGAITEIDLARLEHLEKLKELLVEKLSGPALLNDYHKFCIAQVEKVGPFAFPSQLLQVPSISRQTRFTRPSYQQVFLEENANLGMLEVTVWGKVLRFSMPAAEVLRRIFLASTFTGDEAARFAPELSWSDIATVLSSLVQEEIIQVQQT